MRLGPLFRRALVLAGTLMAGLTSGGSAQAEQQMSVGGLPCHAYGDLAEQLDKKYSEAPISMGIQTNGNLLQVFSSTNSGTWTILSIAPSGRTCVVAAGKSWESFDAGESGPEA